MARGVPIKDPTRRTSPARLANFYSSCGNTKDGIDPDEEIVLIDGTAWHKECAEAAGYWVPDEY